MGKNGKTERAVSCILRWEHSCACENGAGASIERNGKETGKL